MTGSRKGLKNIDIQLKSLQKDYNQNSGDLVGEQLAILDCVAFKKQHERTSFNICESKAKQHKSSRKRGNANRQRVMGHTDYSERSY